MTTEEEILCYKVDTYMTTNSHLNHLIAQLRNLCPHFLVGLAFQRNKQAAYPPDYSFYKRNEKLKYSFYQ